MRVITVLVAIVTASIASSGAVQAAPKKKQIVVARSATGTVIQPTRTIIHNPNGTTTIIVTPRRSYLNPGTEVSPGDGSQMDYMLPPGGDPGRPYWFYGPGDATGGAFMISRPYYLPGINNNTPY
jgi:hypothetical protein